MCQWFRAGESGVCVSSSEQEGVVCVSVVQSRREWCVCQWFRAGECGVCVSGSELERVVCVSVVQSRREWGVFTTVSELCVCIQAEMEF